MQYELTFLDRKLAKKFLNEYSTQKIQSILASDIECDEECLFRNIDIISKWVKLSKAIAAPDCKIVDLVICEFSLWRGKQATQLCLALKCNTSIKRLHLDWPYVNVKELITSIPNTIEDISLSSIHIQDLEDWNSFLNLFDQKLFPKLKRISIRNPKLGFRIYTQELGKIISNNDNLTHLSFISFQDLKRYIGPLNFAFNNKSLIYLNLNYSITSIDLNDLLLLKSSNIQELKLVKIGDITYFQFTELKSYHNLKYLDLSLTNIDISLILEKFKSNSIFSNIRWERFSIGAHGFYESYFSSILFGLSNRCYRIKLTGVNEEYLPYIKTCVELLLKTNHTLIQLQIIPKNCTLDTRDIINEIGKLIELNLNWNSSPKDANVNLLIDKLRVIHPKPPQKKKENTLSKVWNWAFPIPPKMPSKNALFDTMFLYWILQKKGLCKDIVRHGVLQNHIWIDDPELLGMTPWKKNNY